MSVFQGVANAKSSLRMPIQGGNDQSGLIAHEGEENGSHGRTAPAESISADMTVAQLREVAISRGVEVPKRVSKAKLLEILGA